MKRTIIEEGIYNIKTRKSIKKAIFTFDNNEMTRQLIGYGDDNKIDRIKSFTTKIEIPLSDIFSNSVNYDLILNKIKTNVDNMKSAYQRNIDNEIPFFKNPIIIEEDV